MNSIHLKYPLQYNTIQMLANQTMVWVDSDYASSGTSSQFTYRLNIPRDTEYDSVALIQATIPKSYYLVKSGANTLTLEEDSKQATITMPAGNYSMTSFRTVMQTQLTAGSPNGYTYTVSQPATATEASTGKYTYTVSGNGGIQPILIFPSSSELYLQCGFDSESSNQFSADSLVSSNVVDFNTTKGLMIKSDMINGRGSDNTHGSAILQEIFQFNTFDFSNIGFQNANPFATGKKLISSHPEVVRFTITDLNDKTLDFNGAPVNFSLLFYKEDHYHDLAIKDIKMRFYNDLYGTPQLQPNATN